MSSRLIATLILAILLVCHAPVQAYDTTPEPERDDNVIRVEISGANSLSEAAYQATKALRSEGFRIARVGQAGFANIESTEEVIRDIGRVQISARLTVAVIDSETAEIIGYRRLGDHGLQRIAYDTDVPQYDPDQVQTSSELDIDAEAWVLMQDVAEQIGEVVDTERE